MTIPLAGGRPAVAFGREFKEKYFETIDSDTVVVNHGSFGYTPTPVLEKFGRLIVDENRFPDRYIKVDQKVDYVKSLKILGEKVLQCDYRNLALVENTTVGINTVLRLFGFEKNECIVMPNTTYGSCYNTVMFLEKYLGIKVVVVKLDYPLNDEEVVTIFELEFTKYRPRMCLFDTVASSPGVRLPFERLVKLCKQYDVVSLIDGAHGIGLVSLDLGSLQPDFLVSNLHKWFYVPRSCAVLYVDSKNFGDIQTLPISHSYISDESALPYPPELELIEKFFYVGTKLYAQIASIKTAYEFRNDICGGEKAINDYCTNLCYQVGDFLTTKKWPGTTIIDNEKSLITAMINVEVPLATLASQEGFSLDHFEPENPTFWSTFKNFFETDMTVDYKTLVPLFYHNSKLYARFSCQIYNLLLDYDYASDVVLKVITKFFKHKLYQNDEFECYMFAKSPPT